MINALHLKQPSEGRADAARPEQHLHAAPPIAQPTLRGGGHASDTVTLQSTPAGTIPDQVTPVFPAAARRRRGLDRLSAPRTNSAAPSAPR
jgi:hypothetical protein